jgi:hypothetical protein
MNKYSAWVNAQHAASAVKHMHAFAPDIMVSPMRESQKHNVVGDTLIQNDIALMAKDAALKTPCKPFKTSGMPIHHHMCFDLHINWLSKPYFPIT